MRLITASPAQVTPAEARTLDIGTLLVKCPQLFTVQGEILGLTAEELPHARVFAYQDAANGEKRTVIERTYTPTGTSALVRDSSVLDLRQFLPTPSEIRPEAFQPPPRQPPSKRRSR